MSVIAYRQSHCPTTVAPTYQTDELPRWSDDIDSITRVRRSVLRSLGVMRTLPRGVSVCAILIGILLVAASVLYAQEQSTRWCSVAELDLDLGPQGESTNSPARLLVFEI